MPENYFIVMYTRMYKYYIITNVFVYLLLIDYLKHFRSSNKPNNVFWTSWPKLSLINVTMSGIHLSVP